jgi:iron complex outermembrane receptor protein
MNAKTPANTQNVGARTEGLWQLGKAKLYAGADFRSEAAQGTREREFLMGPNAGKIFNDNAWQDSRITKTGVFASYLVPVGSYVVSVAGRLDLNHAEAADNAEEFVKVNPTQSISQFNPGISAGIKRDLGQNFNAGLWLARVKRSGSITERFINYFPVGVDPYEMLGNPDLAPETNNQVDLVFGFNKAKITAEVNLFAAYLTDYITAEKTELKPRIPTSPGVRKYVNIDRAVKTGFEAAFSQALFYGISHQLMVAYTYGQNLVISEALPEIAPMDVRYSILGSHLDNKLHSAIRLRYVADQNRVSESFSEKASPRFTLLDIDVSYAVSSLIAIKGGAQNLLNETYYEHLNRPIAATGTPLFAPGRNFFLMLSFKFP